MCLVQKRKKEAIDVPLEPPSVREVFNSHLQESFDQILREALEIESEWTMLNPITLLRVFGAVVVRSPVPVVAATLIGDIVWWWKEYFRGLFSPTDTPPVEETDNEDSVVESISQVEVSEIISQYCVTVGTVPMAGQTRVCSTYLKRGTEVCSNYRRSHSSASLGKSIPEYLRGEFDQVKPWVQEELCGFSPCVGTLDQLYTPVHMYFVDAEKVFHCVPHGTLCTPSGIQPA